MSALYINFNKLNETLFPVSLPQVTFAPDFRFAVTWNEIGLKHSLSGCHSLLLTRWHRTCESTQLRANQHSPGHWHYFALASEQIARIESYSCTWEPQVRKRSETNLKWNTEESYENQNGNERKLPPKHKHKHTCSRFVNRAHCEYQTNERRLKSAAIAGTDTVCWCSNWSRLDLVCLRCVLLHCIGVWPVSSKLKSSPPLTTLVSSCVRPPSAAAATLIVAARVLLFCCDSCCRALSLRWAVCVLATCCSSRF